MLKHPFIVEFHDYTEDRLFEKINTEEFAFDHEYSNFNDILRELLSEIMSKFK